MARQDLNLTASEISTHNSRSSCWVVIKGKVYDVTDFLDEHPGGAKVILMYAGRDATEAFEPIHPEGTLDELAREKHLGDVVDPQNVQQPAKEEPKRNWKLKEVGGEVVEEVEQQLGLHECINLHDFERAARTGLPRKAWTYYSSGATDEITLRLNSSIFSRILFRPRVLNDVSVVATSTSILGHETSLPFFVSPAAMGRLAHFDGEKCLARGAGEFGIAYMVSSNASLSAEEIISSSRSPRQPFFFQLYVNTDRPKSEAIISRIEKAGYKAIVLTVDSAVAGKRELDEREKADVVVASDTSGSAAIPKDSKGAGIGRAIGAYIDPSLSWKDLDWLRSRTKLPIIVKGIQHVEDAKKAIEWGVDAIYLSNHGGRSVDTSPPAIMILLELRRDLPHLFGPQPHGVRSKKVPEIYIDGGVRRGTDIVKALCLGAKAVGIGRSFMYSLLFGDEGVKTVCQVLKDEIETTMRLIGVTRLEDLGPHLVNTKAIDGMMGDPEPATVGGFSWWKRARL